MIVVMMVMGFALAPLLDVGTDPTSRQGKQLTIRCEWPQVSAKVVEQNLTAPIEGMVSALKGVESVSSRSSFGHCEVNVRLKENQNVSTVKFSISSMLRQSYAKFVQIERRTTRLLDCYAEMPPNLCKDIFFLRHLQASRRF